MLLDGADVEARARKHLGREVNGVARSLAAAVGQVARAQTTCEAHSVDVLL